MRKNELAFSKSDEMRLFKNIIDIDVYRNALN